MAKVTNKGKKKTVKRNIDRGQVHVNASFNNTLITLTDANGNALGQSSAGALGYKGSKKSTPFAASQAADVVAKKAVDNGIKKVEVFIKGAGAGRESVIRSFASAGIEVTLIQDVSPIPHNGCRPPKRRRV